jgi:uncharacterized protein (TIGR00645 family)
MTEKSTTNPATAASALERNLERVLFASRWLLAPIYLGLGLAILAIAIKFFQEIFHLLPHIFEVKEADMVLTVLGLVDLALVASLLLMVMLSSYENFVSQIDIEEGKGGLDWLGKLDSGTLKIKVAASIVAISSIHLLRAFMNAQQIENDKLMWYTIMHMAFVFSALLLGILDKVVFGKRAH